MLIKAGVPLVSGLNLIADSLSNEVFKDGLKNIALDVERGRPLSTAMSKYKFFPPLLWRMVAIGEETGKMEEVLTKVIEYYENETKDLIDNMSKLLEPMITIFLGVIAEFLASACAAPNPIIAIAISIPIIAITIKSSTNVKPLFFIQLI